jgi:hypothetical protein
MTQDPNALDAKVLSEFDHVKNELQLDDEGNFFLLWIKAETSCTFFVGDSSFNFRHALL